MGKNQATPSFADCPQLALTAIHDTLLHGNNVEGEYCGCPAMQHASSFRMTCKAFHSAGACWPSALKLAFEEPLREKACRSLAQILSTSTHTQLSLRYEEVKQDLDNEWDNKGGPIWLSDKHFQDGPWITPLIQSALAQRVVKLEIPTGFLNAALSACRAMPSLKELVLHVNKDTQMGSPYFWDSNGSTNLLEEKRAAAWLGHSQLSSLAICSPLGQAPFNFNRKALYQYSDPRPLPLEALPCFRTLVLRGPIVQQGERLPLSLPPNAKVVIDPGLGSRRPTQWARSVMVYDRFADMPPTAVPKADEYWEEDADARLEHMRRFRSLVLSEARALIADESDDVDDYYDEGQVEEVMAQRGIAARSDLLFQQARMVVDMLARDIADSYLERSWEECTAGGSGQISEDG